MISRNTSGLIIRGKIMRFFNPKKIEYLFKKLPFFTESFLLKRRAERYLKKQTEPEILILEDLVSQGQASIDIGVYRGMYSYHLLKYSEFVYAFEANSLLIDKIKKSFKNNNNIKIENLAISSSSGTTKLKIPIRDENVEHDHEQKYQLGIASIHAGNDLDNLNYHSIDVKKITLDQYHFQHKIGFIKIDVEGHELDIIRGGKNLLERDKPNLLVEIEERHTGLAPQLVIREIKNLGYQCYILNQEFELEVINEKEDFNFNNNNFIFKPNK
tara:strand:+ start:872 stop:1684 length:813 start_codon:yes stop_codon:yes gene_type:complete